MEKFNDDTLMPFGKFKGDALCNVKDGYLKWFYNDKLDEWITGGIDKASKLGKLMTYIEENLDVKVK